MYFVHRDDDLWFCGLHNQIPVWGEKKYKKAVTEKTLKIIVKNNKYHLLKISLSPL